MKDEIQKHRAYAYENGTDAPEINNWRWSLGLSS
jgi:xylulose-5-phosphate/fructose-6-phosphate phosphoketolase